MMLLVIMRISVVNGCRVRVTEEGKHIGLGGGG